MARDITDIRIDRQREAKFSQDIKTRLSLSGLSVAITPDGLLVEYPNGELCALVVINRTGARTRD